MVFLFRHVADNNYRQQDKKPTRRSVLKSMGAGSAGLAAVPSLGSLTDVQIFGSATAATGSADDASNRSLVIEATDEVEYVFTVTGLLSAVDAPSDIVEMGTGSATLENDSHEFSFTGEFTAFDIEGDATVIVDGERFNYETFPHNTLEIVADNSVDYDVSATGAVEIESGDAERPNARRVAGTISGGNDSELVLHSSTSTTHTLSYAGELTYLDIDGNATVVDNGTELNRAQSLPTIEPGQAKIESHGAEHEYYLHLGWDVTAESRTDRVNDIEYGGVHGTATSRPVAFSFGGFFRFVEVPDIGAVKYNPENGTVKCLSLNNEGASISISTADGSEKQVAVESGEPKTSELSGRITHVRIEAGNRLNTDGIELSIEPGATAEAALRAKKLQLAAKLEREPEFETLGVHADARGGRIRQDSDGIYAFRVATPSDTTDQSQRDLYIGAQYDLIDIDGHDIVSIRLTQNMATEEIEEAKVIHRSRTKNNVPQSVEVGELVVENGKNNRGLGTHSIDHEEHPRVTTETIYTHEIADNLRPHTTKSDRTALQSTTLEYNLNQELSTHGITDTIKDGTDVVVDTVEDGTDAATDIAKDGADIAVDGTEAAISVTLSGVGTFSDWNYIEGNFQGFSKRGAKTLNRAFKSASPFATIAPRFIEDGEVNSCNGCIAVGLVIIDVGVGKASTPLCALLGTAGGVGGLGCALAVSTLADLIQQYGAEAGLQKMCQEATLC